ncbi:4Fe-4S binding protein [Methanolacinia petrolearia]|nr:4Fe-4S binding protein [Methanolacinia petrolearia]
MIVIRREICGYCGACVSVCPEAALELVDAYLEIDAEKCKNCRICVRVCPLGALGVSDEE